MEDEAFWSPSLHEPEPLLSLHCLLRIHVCHVSGAGLVEIALNIYPRDPVANLHSFLAFLNEVLAEAHELLVHVLESVVVNAQKLVGMSVGGVREFEEKRRRLELEAACGLPDLRIL